MDAQVIDNAGQKRYELNIDGNLAILEYIRATDAVYLTHTEVPSTLKGQGVGSSLVEQVLQLLREQNEKVVPLCPFVAGYIKRNPKYTSLLARGYNV
ncbi:MAG: GNAT family N-acetyltransferase [Flavobacteriaceae bacterium]|nr:GNAT family N-acetyltransferase [Flavobacteriaceae bacterium]